MDPLNPNDNPELDNAMKKAAVNALCTGDQIKITVLPFQPQTDNSKSFRELQELGMSNGEVGMVKATTFARVDGCNVIVGYKDPVKYVAKDLNSNQCAYDHVSKHEDHHLEMYQDALNDLEPRIRDSAKTMPLFDAAAKEVTAVKQKHQDFDSPEEYDTNVTACGGAIPQLIRKKRF